MGHYIKTIYPSHAVCMMACLLSFPVLGHITGAYATSNGFDTEVFYFMPNGKFVHRFSSCVYSNVSYGYYSVKKDHILALAYIDPSRYIRDGGLITCLPDRSGDSLVSIKTEIFDLFTKAPVPYLSARLLSQQKVYTSDSLGHFDIMIKGTGAMDTINIFGRQYRTLSISFLSDHPACDYMIRDYLNGLDPEVLKSNTKVKYDIQLLNDEYLRLQKLSSKNKPVWNQGPLLLMKLDSRQGNFHIPHK